MEDKVKRECKAYIEKLFKEYDKIGSGAIVRQDMRKIMEALITGFNEHEELEDKIDALAKPQKYTTPNSKTRTMEVQYLDDALDFPSTMAIVVSFLNKYERRNTNAFAGKGLVTCADLPKVDKRSDLQRQQSEGKRPLY